MTRHYLRVATCYGVLCVLFGWSDPGQISAQGTADQVKLGQIAIEANEWSIGRLAVEKLTDQAVLAKVAAKDAEQDIRRLAVEKLTDQTVLAKVVAKDAERDIRRLAVEKLTDQAVLAKVAVEDADSSVRGAAVAKLTNQTVLAEIAMKDASLDVRIAAIGKVTDQVLLQRWAASNPQAAIRLVAVKRITDDRFLVQRLPKEPSVAVRSAIVETLHEQASMRDTALTAYHAEDRKHALQRLEREFPGTIASDVAAAHETLAAGVKALAAETDNGKLLALAVKGEVDALRYAAARRLTNPATLEQAALHSRDREVLKILLAKLEDKTVLKRVASASDDRAMRLAAAHKAGTQSWNDIFRAATSKGATAEKLGDALAAVSLFSSAQSEAREAVQQACLNLIRLGDESRIPEMVDLLEGYGDKILGEDYLNSSQPDLAIAGRAWAHRRGYDVRTGPGSNRATWGSDKYR